MSFTEAYLLTGNNQKLDILSFDFSKSTASTPDIGVVRVITNRLLWLRRWLSEPEINQRHKQNVAGIAPDFRTEVLEADVPEDTGQRIELGYEFVLFAKQGDTQIRIPKLFINQGGLTLERISQERNADGSSNRIYSIELADERRFWRERGVVAPFNESGDYTSNSFNVPSNYGVPVENGDGLFAKNTVKFERRKYYLYNLFEIIRRLVYFLPNHRGRTYELVWREFTDASVRGEIPIDINVRGGASAVQEISKLLNRYEMLFTYLTGNRVAAITHYIDAPPADGFLPSSHFPKDKIVEIQPKYLATWLPITYRVGSTKPIIKDAFCDEFEMVAQNPETSEWQAYDISISDVKIGGVSMGIGAEQLKQQALQTLGGQGFELDIIPEAWRDALRRSAYRCFRMVDSDLPVTRERMLPDDDGDIKPRPHKIVTTWIDASENKDPSAGSFWISRFGTLSPDSYRVTSDGVIQFRVLLGNIGADEVSIDQADLELEKIAMDYQYISDEYYIYAPTGSQEDARHAHFISVDWIQYDKHNKAELDKKAQDLAKAKWAGLTNSVQGGSRTFAGFHQIMPDGEITQVVWQLEENGRPFTRVLLQDYNGGIEGRPSAKMSARAGTPSFRTEAGAGLRFGEGVITQ